MGQAMGETGQEQGVGLKQPSVRGLEGLQLAVVELVQPLVERRVDSQLPLGQRKNSPSVA